MKAVRFHTFGDADVLRLDDVPRPEPAAGQVLVRVHATSVNPLERRLRSGSMQAVMPIALPFTPGCDLSGVVEGFGPGVTGFALGQEVFGCVPATVGGACAEFMVAATEVLIARPAGLDVESAASAPSVALTAWQALFVKGELAEGQSVLVHGGAGGVGLYAVQLAKWKGARVTATASAQDLDFVAGFGADEVIDYQDGRFEDKVSGIDVVIDLVGGPTQKRSWQTMKPGGILVGSTAPPSPEDAARHGMRAAMVQMLGQRAQLETIGELLAAGNIKPFVGAVFPLAEAAAAHRASESGHVRGKIVIRVGE